MKTSKKILAIALDAAEPDLIEKWISDGSLRNLARLRANGTYGRLASTAEWLAGSPWPTFYTGALPGQHGFYHYLQWKGSKMDYERPGPEWINAIPFWRRLGNDYNVFAIDIPLTFPPTEFNGIEISGWASHDRIYPTSSYPKEKIEWVIKHFGKPPIDTEVGGLQDIKDLFHIKDELLLANQKEVDLITSLLKNENWDLCLCCFSSPHRGGHKFWDTTNVKGIPSKNEILKLNSSLKEIYQSCDNAIGKILSQLNENVTILVFSLHGMGANNTIADKMLPQIIANILNGEKETKTSTNLIKKFRKVIPLETRSRLKTFLPIWMQDKMTTYWRIGGINWNQTKVFSLLADLQGYIRINLKEREKDGIVKTGEEFESLCNKLIDGLKTFEDEKTQESIIEDVKRSDQLFDKGVGFNNLPDILIKWKNKSSADYTRIISPKFGEIECPSPGKNPDGRSGNHRFEGFLLAAGEGIKSNGAFNKKHIIDLAPTILHLMNITKLERMEGNIISEIFE